MPYVGNKPFKSKLKALEDDAFEMRSVKNATQFSRTLLNITNYVKMKYNDEVGNAIRNLRHPVSTYPGMPKEWFELDKDGNQIYQRPNEIKVFM